MSESIVASSRIDFTKIKYNPKNERVVLNYQVENGTDEPDEYSVSTRQAPHPDLVQALQDLARHVLRLCELTGVEEDEISVRSVSFSWAHGVMGCTITALRALKLSPSPLVLNTPHKTVDHYGEEGDDNQLLPSSTVDALEELIQEARLFLRGKRGESPQTELDLEGEREDSESLEFAGAGV